MPTGLFAQSVWEGALLAGADFSHACLDMAVLQRAWARGACFEHAQLRYSELSYADFTGADFSDALFERTRFHRSLLDDARFSSRDGVIERDEELWAAEERSLAESGRH
ncbi:pentapeptide repeat-containing protein [Azotobacter sp. CWF10]